MTAPGAKPRVTIETDVVYGTTGTGGRSLHCDVYQPPPADDGRPQPAVVMVHGGSWVHGERADLRGYGLLVGREGYVCVTPEYRLLDEGGFPHNVHDVKACVRWVRANADELGVDPDRIAVQGNSAGGHLALVVAATPKTDGLEGDGGHAEVSSEVAVALAIYPPTRLQIDDVVPGATPVAHAAAAGLIDEPTARLLSPIEHVTPSFPPTLLIHGTADEVVPHEASSLMFETLLAAGVPAELHMVADQLHAFDREPQLGRQCALEMINFLRRYL